MKSFPCGPKIYDFRAAVSLFWVFFLEIKVLNKGNVRTYVFFKHDALLAVVSVRHPWAVADDAAALIAAVVAFVTDAHQRAGVHV